MFVDVKFYHILVLMHDFFVAVQKMGKKREEGRGIERSCAPRV